MSRTKGAKNRIKSIAELEIMLVDAKAEKNQVTAIKKDEIPIDKYSRQSFKILTPDNEPEKSLKEDFVLRCGNPVCGKVLDNLYSRCPYCGCILSWE